MDTHDASTTGPDSRLWSRCLSKVNECLSFSDRPKWLMVSASIGFCVAPTFISYRKYQFSWDDSDYLRRSIEVSSAFWSGNVHGLGAMVGIRPPLMALLGVPWGPVASWNAAGNYFVSLAALTALLVAVCLYLLLRIGVKPLLLLAAFVCVLASIGPYPHATSSVSLNWVVMSAAAHFAATAFLADSLFAWTVLAAVLLIPYEARIPPLSTRVALFHGILWGLVLSLGIMNKLNFIYFLTFTLPILLFITFYQRGLRFMCVAFAGFLASSAPSAFYLARWGKPAFENLTASSFGGVAAYYYIPLWPFLAQCVRESPGLLLSIMLMVAGLIYLMNKKRIFRLDADFVPLVIVLVFGLIVLAAPNRQIRYAFPAIVALPFLTAVLISGKGGSTPRLPAALTAVLVFCGLAAAAIPMRHRGDIQSISRADAVLAQVSACNARNIVLATDSPTLNGPLMQLAIELSHPRVSIKVDNLADHAMSGVRLVEDFAQLSEEDQVVLQDKDRLSPPFTNMRAATYESYVRQRGYVPTRVEPDISVYEVRCGTR